MSDPTSPARRPIPQAPTHTHRFVTLVITEGDPRATFEEFLNSLDEGEETAVLDFLAEHLPLLRVCREIEEVGS